MHLFNRKPTDVSNSRISTSFPVKGYYILFLKGQENCMSFLFSNNRAWLVNTKFRVDFESKWMSASPPYFSIKLNSCLQTLVKCTCSFITGHQSTYLKILMQFFVHHHPAIAVCFLCLQLRESPFLFSKYLNPDQFLSSFHTLTCT